MRDFDLEIKSLTEAGTFQGLASTYDNIDDGGDRIERGAFTRTLQKRSEVPVLWAHDMAAPVALGTLTDSAEGLRIQAALDLDTTAGKEAHSRLKKRIVRGLSIGYRIPPGGSTLEKGIRIIRDLDLFEVSLVAIGMNSHALVTAVKSQISTVRNFEQFLRNAGFSKSEAVKISLHGFTKGLALHDEPEADPIVTDLAEWLKGRAA